MTKVSRKILKQAIIEYKGQVATIARNFNMASNGLRQRIARDPELEELLQSQRELLIDKAENVLEAAIDKGELDAAKFALKTIGKNRGYVERQETQDVVLPTEININIESTFTKIATNEEEIEQ